MEVVVVVVTLFMSLLLVGFGNVGIALDIPYAGLDIEVVIVRDKYIGVVAYMEIVVYNKDIEEEHKEILG